MLSKNEIKVKSVYVKIIFLTDERNNSPAFHQYIHRLGKTIPVYDYAILYSYRDFDSENSDKHIIKASSFGTVETFMLHPFMKTSKSIDTAENQSPHLHKIEIFDPPNSITNVSHFYNGLQKRYESWHGLRSEDNINVLNLTVDFSSIPTKSGNPIHLFKTKPLSKIEYKDGKGKIISEELEFDLEKNNIFSVSTKQLNPTSCPKNSILKMYWDVEWDNLLDLHSLPESIDMSLENNKKLKNDDLDSRKINSEGINLNVEKIENLQIQQNSNDSIQMINENNLESVNKIIEKLNEIIPTSGLTNEEKDELVAEIKAVEYLNGSEHPLMNKIKDKIQTISNLIGGEKAFSPVLSLISVFLSKFL